ncbi:hypothetical protein [Ideonella sp.]|uniref:hypothetical protein n=1 Tax=Ideonella sp. TaxID=1929293 RepID=UPI0035B3BE23
MSKIITIAAVLLATAGAAQAAKIPANIKFDGYCDGFTNLTVNGGYVTGQRDFTNCGTYTPDAVMGPTGKLLAGSLVKGYSLTEASAVQFGTTYGWVVNTDGTWSVYATESGSLINSGTWSAGYPLTGAKADGKVSTAK